MTNQHPITPPPELVEQWARQWTSPPHYGPNDLYQHIADQSAQWGADQELEAFCEWFQFFYRIETWMKKDLARLRSTRRPKPPSLKEQALAVINSTSPYLDETAINTIRKALEAL